MEQEDERTLFSKRLNEVLDNEGYKKKGKNRNGALAKDMHLSAQGVRKWTSGESMPGIENGAQLAKLLNVAFEWLMTGRGNKHVPETLSVDAIRVAKLFDNLSEESKRALFEYAAYLSEKMAKNSSFPR